MVLVIPWCSTKLHHVIHNIPNPTTHSIFEISLILSISFEFVLSTIVYLILLLSNRDFTVSMSIIENLICLYISLPFKLIKHSLPTKYSYG